ncbi:MAG: hypothetical protein AAB676_21570 [Verrucomicrobiota bacterium]
MDYYALLHEPRRPWIDPERLKAKFLALLAAAHPDRVHRGDEAEKAAAQERAAELNAAYHCLREPKERLQHLLELEGSGNPAMVTGASAAVTDLFFEVGQACREVDAFLGEKEKATSPLLKVRLFEQGMTWSDRINRLQAKIDARREELMAELRGMNPAWESVTREGGGDRAVALPLSRLEEIFRLVSYFARWTQQLQERALKLSL